MLKVILNLFWKLTQIQYPYQVSLKIICCGVKRKFDLQCFIQDLPTHNIVHMEQQKRIYNKPIQGSKQPGYSHIYRNSNFFGSLTLPNTSNTPEQNSLKSIFIDLFLNKYPERKYLAKIQVDVVEEGGQKVEKRSLQNILTYKEGHDVAVRLASALLKLGLTFQKKEYNLSLVGIYSRNRQEFYLADLAFILYGITCVPLYDTLGIQNLSYCLEHSQITTCICGISNAKTLLNLQNRGNLKNLILCDQLDAETEKALKQKFNVFDFWKLVKEEALQNALSYKNFNVEPEKCFTFSYTSGTTGVPKCAMLSQQNVLSFCRGYYAHHPGLDRKTDNEVHLSILPMPHVYERIVIANQIFIGGFIVPTSGNILKLKQDINLVKPTQIIAVPRLYNRFMQYLYDTFGGEEGVRKLIEQRSPILHKIRQGFGGRVKYMLTGSAPINAKVLELFGKVMGVPFCEAYGQTQNTGGAFMQTLQHDDYGNVGVIWPTLEFKLADIPQMGYTSDDKDSQGRPTPRGQIWLRGAGVFLGYYKSEQLTKEAITQDGWLKTGDVGILLPGSSNMKLIDRKKNIFKLAQGQYVASEKVEHCYVKSKYVSEAFLHGDSLQSFAVCIAVVNKVQIQKLGKELGLEKSYLDLCQDRQVLKHVLSDLIERGHEGKLNGYEQAKNLRIEPQAFAIRGIVSTTMKLQRFQARRFYKKQIDQMYQEGPLIQHAS